MKCKCNRIGEHCPQCGSISKHPLIQRTAAAFGILHLEVRYYRCRKCGVEYGWYQGKFYEQECLAPPDIKIVAVKKEPIEVAKLLDDAFKILRSYGADLSSVSFPKGILEEPIDLDSVQEISREPSPQITKDEILTEAEKELGFTRDVEGKLVAPFSIDDFLRKKKEESNEGDNSDKS